MSEQPSRAVVVSVAEVNAERAYRQCVAALAPLPLKDRQVVLLRVMSRLVIQSTNPRALRRQR